MFNHLILLAMQLLADLELDATARLSQDWDALEHCLANGDLTGARLKAADVAFFAALAYHNRLLNFNEAMIPVALCAQKLESTLYSILNFAETKYALRATRPDQPVDEVMERNIASYWHR